MKKNFINIYIILILFVLNLSGCIDEKTDDSENFSIVKFTIDHH